MLAFIKKWPVLSASAATSIISMMILICLAAAHWPGATNNCFDIYMELGSSCFCERPRGDGPGDAWVAQPMNTYSGLGFTFMSLLIGWSADTKKFPSPRFWQNKNFITEEVSIQASFAAVFAFMGPGSMYMHASQTQLGGTVDVLSMVFYMLWVCGYALMVRLFYPRRTFVMAASVTYVLSVVLVILLHAFNRKNFSIFTLFTRLLKVFFASEGLTQIWYLLMRKKRMNYWYLLTSLLSFWLAYYVWGHSSSGGKWCYPNSLFQGHAVWHVFASISLGLYFFYLGSERPWQTAAPAPPLTTTATEAPELFPVGTNVTTADGSRFTSGDEV